MERNEMVKEISNIFDWENEAEEKTHRLRHNTSANTCTRSLSLHLSNNDDRWSTVLYNIGIPGFLSHATTTGGMCERTSREIKRFEKLIIVLPIATHHSRIDCVFFLIDVDECQRTTRELTGTDWNVPSIKSEDLYSYPFRSSSWRWRTSPICI